MLNILLGAIITIALFSTHFIAYKAGRKHKKTDIVAKLSEEEERIYKKHLEGIENVLNYDYNVAIGRKANK